MKIILASLFVFLSALSMQAQEKSRLLFVSSETAYLRSGPGEQYNVVAELSKSMPVQMIGEFDEWWTVQYKTLNGFILKENLISIEIDAPKVVEKVVERVVVKEVKVPANNTPAPDAKYDSWDTTEYETGETPECLNIIPEFDYKMDNYLRIKNDGSDTEAVVKLIRIDTPNGDELTYRIAYIQNGDTHFMRNVPVGKYYLKIAYGKDWRETTIGGNCYGKFVQNPQYEKGGDIVDFTPIRTSEGTELPSYELSLDVNHNGSGESLETDDISEKEFNN